MNRRAIAVRLTLIVALAGLLPIAAVGVISIELLRRRIQQASQEALQTIAEQAAIRTSNYLAHQRELVRVVAALAADKRRLEEVVLEAPSLGRVTLVGPEISEWPLQLRPKAITAVTEGKEIYSDVYFAPDTTPAMDICVPTPALRQHAVCAQLDLLELWKFVNGIRIGETGYALAFDAHGHLVASGSGALRAAVLTRERIAESDSAEAVSRGDAVASTGYKSASGQRVIAGWARMKDLNWAIVVEQPTKEALRSAQTAQWLLGGVLLLALAASVGVGLWESQRVLRELEIEERWRTAGRIAAGITHDLGHRLRILEQTAALADASNPAFLPRIRDNLRAELDTLKKFVSDFSHLARDLRSLELIPLELGAFLQSARLTAGPYAQAAGMSLQIRAPDVPLWVRADRHLLERAILNLITNAMEASPPGAVIQLSAIRRPGGHGIEVTDRGTGIDPQRLSQLFDAFNSTKRTGAHLGMGLPNVKRIVEAHGGRISVESQPGVGTTFQIWLPQAIAPQESATNDGLLPEDDVSTRRRQVHRPS